jgi:hypothetical protein
LGGASLSAWAMIAGGSRASERARAGKRRTGGFSVGVRGSGTFTLQRRVPQGKEKIAGEAAIAGLKRCYGMLRTALAALLD